MDNLKDRGMMKWQGMMLTEHIKMLEEWDNEYENVERPQLEDWEQDLIAEEIERAFKSKSTVRLSYWSNGQLKEDYGVPIEINTTSKSIVIDDPFGTMRYSFETIVAASIID